jgi:hypothetical protein
MIFCKCKSSFCETALLQRASNWPERPAFESLTPTALQEIAKRESIDFATTLLFDRFQKSSRHADFIHEIDRLRRSPAKPQGTRETKIVLIPGALYLERPDLGGDGRLVRETAINFGWPVDMIPLKSAGSVLENAGRIHQWLLKHADEKIILVSLSKGGKDLLAAFGLMDPRLAVRNIVAWVNVGGPLNGSLMADWVLSSRIRTYLFRAQFWLQNRSFNFITELRHDSGVVQKLSTRLPQNLKIINVVGFPLSQHFNSSFSRFCHRKLSVYGPNDGTILLSDICAWPGEIYPVWGADHYFRPETLAREVITAILKYLSLENSLEQSIPLHERATGARQK